MTKSGKKKIEIKEENPDLKEERTLKYEGKTDTITRYQQRTNEEKQKIDEAMEDKHMVEEENKQRNSGERNNDIKVVKG